MGSPSNPSERTSSTSTTTSTISTTASPATTRTSPRTTKPSPTTTKLSPTTTTRSQTRSTESRDAREPAEEPRTPLTKTETSSSSTASSSPSPLIWLVHAPTSSPAEEPTSDTSHSQLPFISMRSITLMPTTETIRNPSRTRSPATTEVYGSDPSHSLTSKVAITYS